MTDPFFPPTTALVLRRPEGASKDAPVYAPQDVQKNLRPALRRRQLLHRHNARRAAEQRVSEHAAGVIPGCFTFPRRPVVLACSEHYERIDEAVAAERRLKGWSRAKKEAYMRGDYERLSKLAKRRRGGA